MDVDTILALCPGLCRSLVLQQQFDLRNLTSGQIPDSGGVYLFSKVDDDTPLYVGRTSRLSLRVGTDHRSIDENLAPLTARIKSLPNIHTMEEAREYLYENCRVRMLVEPDRRVRAILETYVILKLNPEFNQVECG